ncbi:ABC transporter ATP-binding protein [Halodesulfovibrio sp.]|jgi:cobalt/nickel transport system ATP-binding protein|uniref:energy-coupling factor ABC transporter ATP-binding protein n=1 Tax=Halodesulfovibrio sp. TaxID=1912772 RepID=UPI0025F51A39|nr:ABC transporter ATP-binding protein [Halodesulfovibrio sp.]MCT4533984.1 energy-coupling factor ABC transporter ATP-binding protein [Halodesulfovibrio sp.]
MTNPLLSLTDIHYTYAGAAAPALSGANLELYPSSRLGVLGDNGSGKTTLFLTAMGILKPHKGCVTYAGSQLKDEKEFRTLRAEIGYLFQRSDDQLFSPTVIDDIAFGPLNLGKTPNEALSTATEMLDLVGLKGFEHRITHKLSGGEKKMVALASILAMRPKALLLDEPTNDLDPATRERLISILASLDIALCIISHDWGFLDKTCTSFLKVENGMTKPTECIPHTHIHTHQGGDATHNHE